MLGGQPPDIGRQVENLARKYIVQKNTLILAVTAANVDIVTSEAIRLAREVDPKGERTLGVITKPDAREQGPEMQALVRVLNNQELPLRKGYVAVKNRSQRQIEQGMDAEEAMKVKETCVNEDNFVALSHSNRKKAGSSRTTLTSSG